MGAMAEDGTLVLSSWIVNDLQPEDEYFRQELERVKSQLGTYIQKFRQGQPLDLQAKTVILADDGIATGETMKAALLWCRSQHPKQVVVAVPVCSPRAIGLFKKLADKLVFLAAPAQFWAVGQVYRDFGQVSEAEVIEYLGKSKAMSPLQPAEPVAAR
jgi:predicted phosphoribosyltransferase